MRALAGVFFLGAVAAVPLIEHNGLKYASEAARLADLPIIKLGYSIQQASSYDSENDIYTFKNIRFAAPPIGNLRFAKPIPPLSTGDEVQTGEYGGTCPQSMPLTMLNTLMGRSAAGYVSGYLGTIDLGLLMSGFSTPETEDCLFLDVIAPGPALRGNGKLPVANWIYGGAFVLGDKGGIYNATGVSKAGQGGIIHVAGNYRLGGFGFLAGTTLEKDNTATPNAGFHDQKAVLEWIQKYIHLFGGNPKQVTAWGESAGGSSIVHQLTQYGGTKDPLFKRAIIQSPGFHIGTWDRKGENEKTFLNFLRFAGCESKPDLGCLRSKDTMTLKNAQDKVIGAAQEGTFAFGPAADGQFVRQLPQLELASGNFWKGLESVIVTHVTDEASMFVDRENVYDDTSYTQHINWEYGNKSVITNALLNKFKLSSFRTGRDRMIDYVKLSTFTCSTRLVAKAYSDRFYMAQVTGIHGTDIISDFLDSTNLVYKIANWMGATSTEYLYQRFLVDYIRSGKPPSWWPKGIFAPEIKNILDVGKVFTLSTDKNNKEEDCEPVIDVLAAATALDGYVPPNGAVKNKIVDISQLGDKVSRNFKG